MLILKNMKGETLTQEETNKLLTDAQARTAETLAETITKKRAIEAKEKELKKSLKDFFEINRIKSIDSGRYTITLSDAVQASMSIDINRLKKEDPATYGMLIEKYPKQLNGRDASVAVKFPKNN